jgi:hypothetical protein
MRLTGMKDVELNGKLPLYPIPGTMNMGTHVFFVCQRSLSNFSALVVWVLLLNVMMIFTAHGSVFSLSNAHAELFEWPPPRFKAPILEGSICAEGAGILAATFVSVRHETVKRGTHQSEMEAGEYVVASSFKSPDNAKHFAIGLRNLEFNARYGYLTEKDLWFVYILRTGDPKKARAEHARVSAMFLLRDAWLITVQP